MKNTQLEWQTLRGNTAQKIIHEVNRGRRTPLFDESSLVETALPDFYGDTILYKLTAFHTVPVISIEYAKAGNRIICLDGTREALAEINAETDLVLDTDTVVHYLWFYLGHLRSDDDSFKLAESIEDVEFTDEVSDSLYQKTSDLLHSARVEEAEAGYLVTASILYDNYLYDAQVFVDRSGEISFTKEEVVLEDVPTRDIMLM
ncbi:MAG: hypothetical protein ACLFR1_11285 [Spirochaetia bacterium]